MSTEKCPHLAISMWGKPLALYVLPHKVPHTTQLGQSGQTIIMWMKFNYFHAGPYLHI